MLTSRPTLLRSRICWVIAALLLCCACQGEAVPTQPDGAYRLFRQAVLEGDGEVVYQFLDKSTHAVFDARVQVLKDMENRIIRFLPQVDQKLARQHTGVVLLDTKNIETGKDLFLVLFSPDKMEVTDEIDVGTDLADVDINEEETEAVVVTYAETQYRMVKEGEVWRVAAWRDLAEQRTQWILDNQAALDQTVEDLINEEKEEVDRVIAYLLKEDKARKKKE